MSSKQRVLELRRWLRTLAPEGNLGALAKRVGTSQTHSGLESVPGRDSEHALAVEGLRQLAAGAKDLPSEQIHSIEAIIHETERPSVLIQDGSYPSLPPPWTHFNDLGTRVRLERVIPSIGRIEFAGGGDSEYAGTGFVVGDGLLMTNRHVARHFSLGAGSNVRLQPGRLAGIDFCEEQDSPLSEEFAIESVVLIHPLWDMALLRVTGLAPRHKPLTLSAEAPSPLSGRDVAVIGYPSRGDSPDPALQDRVFQGIDKKKRLQPGKVTGLTTFEADDEPTVTALAHDSSTLGGNSGSPVIDVATGQVLALHFAGTHRVTNYAVPAWELARDPRIVAAGVRFSRTVNPTNVWEPLWAAANASAESPLSIADARTESGRTKGSMTWTIPLQITVQLGPVSHRLN